MRNRLESLAAAVEQRPALIVTAFLCCYIVALIMPVHRWFWHDELFTYYIARAPDWSKAMWESRHLDLNPPMIYAVTRGWQHILGTSEVVTRIPSAIAFGIASLGFVVFLRRRIGWLWSATAVLMFWASPNFMYATELRPYALLLMFFSLTLLSWDSARSPKYRYPALALVLISACGMMLCHVLAIFPLGAIYLGELFRSFRKREIDWLLWACLLLPLAIVPSYFASTQSQRAETSAYPSIYQGGLRRLSVFFAKTLLGIALPIALATTAVFFAARPAFRDTAFRDTAFRDIAARVKTVSPRDLGLWTGLMLIPVLINVMLSFTHGASFERYSLVSALAIAISAALLLGFLTSWSRAAALCSGLVLIVLILEVNLIQPLLKRPLSLISDQIHSSLPLVVASGLTFLEMDHYEKPELLSHVYFLTDHDSAVKYAHALIFEGMATEAEYFPFRAKVEPFKNFVTAHHKFLVVGTINFPEDWLLRKLIAEGAEVRRVSVLKDTFYKDYEIYEVQVQ